MLNQVNIANTIFQAKWYTSTLLTKLNGQISTGEDVESCTNQFILLCKWIEIMQDYLDTHYDQDGNITPDFDCLTETQILELVAKVKVMLGSYRKSVAGDWLLQYFVWNDAGYWRDSAVWIDTSLI